MRVEQITFMVATGGHKTAAPGRMWLSSHLVWLPSLELHQLALAFYIILFIFSNSNAIQLNERVVGFTARQMERNKMQVELLLERKQKWEKKRKWGKGKI